MGDPWQEGGAHLSMERSEDLGICYGRVAAISGCWLVNQLGEEYSRDCGLPAGGEPATASGGATFIP